MQSWASRASNWDEEQVGIDLSQHDENAYAL